MKKKLLFLSWRDIKHKKMGGAEVFTHEMISRLDHEIYDIVHIAPCSQNKKGEENPLDEVLDGIHYLRRGNMYTVILYAMWYYLMNHRHIDYVVDQCNTHRFFTPLWVPRSKRIFFIHQMTKEIWLMNMSKLVGHVGKLMEGLMTSMYKKSFMTLTVSNSTKTDLMAYGFKEEDIIILPEGINFDPWDEKELKAKDDGLFTYVGRFSKYKGIDATVEAFCRIYLKYPTVSLDIIGKKNQAFIDEVLEPIRIRYDVPEDKIKYLGFVSEEEKLETMSRSHCLVFPSLREGWGLTVTEGAAVGTPSIVYHSPGLVDAVNEGKAGYMTEHNNIYELQEIMEASILDHDEYEQIRRAAYEYSKNFNWSHTAQAFYQAV